MMITLDEFEAGFRDVWRSVQNDFTHKLIDYEADLQACTYYHLRKHFGDSPRDFRILCDYHYDASEFRPDIGLELRRSKQIWITLWFKKVYDVLSREDARDLTEKMPRYQSLGAERGYFCFTAFKDSIRRISFADPSPVSGLEITKHMKDKIERGYDIDVFGEFERRAELGIHRMGEYIAFMEKNGTSKTPSYVAQMDCALLPELKKPDGFRSDLIFFSPPYCNAIEYWRRHRLEYFLGRFLDEKEVVEIKRKFIGRTILGDNLADLQPTGYQPLDAIIDDLMDEGRSHKAVVLWQYFDDMRRRLETFHDYLPENGHCIVVVGDSQTGRKKIPTAKTLTWLGESAGFTQMRTWRYKIKNRAMQFPVKPHPKIQKESILVLQKS